jgi:hypothetical protein
VSGLARLRRIEQGGPARLSLAPGRERATPLEEVAKAAFGTTDMEVRAGLLADLAERFADDYPDNLFCDMEAVAGLLAGGTVEEAAALAKTMAQLSRHYGRHTALRFRYTHDFLYGLDWCRWASKEPAARSTVAPLSVAFLGYLARRGDELSALIAAGDAKYGPLQQGQFRNPFGFDRSPASELLLLRTLASEGLLPFDAWQIDGSYRLTDFAAARVALAKRLGLAADPVVR